MTFKEEQLQKAYNQYIMSKRAEAFRFGILKRAAGYIQRTRDVKRVKQAGLGVSADDLFVLANASRGLLREKTANLGSYDMIQGTAQQLHLVKCAAAELLQARGLLKYAAEEASGEATEETASGDPKAKTKKEKGLFDGFTYDNLMKEENRPTTFGVGGAGVGALLGAMSPREKRLRNMLLGALALGGGGYLAGAIPNSMFEKEKPATTAPAAATPTETAPTA